MSVINRTSTLLGFASWLLPFVVSFLFVGPGGQIVVPQPLFKSIMVVVGGGVGTALLVRAFQTIGPGALSGLKLGTYWFAINLVLDILVLVPMAKMTISVYLADIGLRYLMLPIVAWGLGVVAERSLRGKN